MESGAILWSRVELVVDDTRIRFSTGTDPDLYLCHAL